MASRSGKSKVAGPRVGLEVGDYVLREQIGSGSFAAVHRAKNMRRGGYAAVKCVFTHKLDSKKLRENLHGEIRIMKSIKHPHIVSMIDVRDPSDVKPEYIFLVMEFCQLGDLSHFIKNRDKVANFPSCLDAFKKYPNPDPGGLHEVLVRHFVKQLASALKFLQRKNLIHRDLKPQNVLVAPSTQAREAAHSFMPERLRNLHPVGVPSLPILKIADFGFARILPPQGLAETLCGSPLYMAPEILAYQKYDAKADLWSFGALVYEMVTARPPFRAGNHMELLRVIDRTKDHIRFPAEVAISSGVKDLIRKLLKRNPVERVAFDDLFKQEVIVEPIPGLVDADRVQTEALSQPELLQAAAMERTKSAEREEDIRSSTVQARPEEFVDAVSRQSAQLPNRPKLEQTPTAPAVPVVPVSPSSNDRRPSVTRHSTDVPPQTLQSSPSRRVDAGHRTSTGPPSSQQQQQQQQQQQAPQYSPSRPSPTQPMQRRDEQDRVAQDIAFERDYVVVEKRAVEMNALADEIQASPRIRSHRYSAAGSRPTRPSLAGFQPSSAPTATPQAASRPTASHPNQPDHLRRASFEQRARQSSATSALAKAISMATGRLIPFSGFGVSPPVGNRAGAASTLPTYGAFPISQAQTSYLLIDDGKQSSTPIDEDAKVLQALEEAATQSDVVYGFAQVKYVQIIPQQPSAEHGLGLELGGGEGSADLTADALVTICEEAFVLFVKTLDLLQRCMAIAGAWWAKKNRGDIPEIQAASSRDPKSASQQMTLRVNGVIQWVRVRFNETFEKANFVKLKLKEAQRLLPAEHPAHPGNQTNQQHAPLATWNAAAGGTEEQNQNSEDDVFLSPGISADRIMYLRAVEMMRSAAVSELMNDDLKGCEISYITAIRMLEVVVEGNAADKRDDDRRDRERDASQADTQGDLDDEDKESMLKMLQTAKGRLQGLRKKLDAFNRRSSATPAPQRSPPVRPASLSPAHASAR